MMSNYLYEPLLFVYQVSQGPLLVLKCFIFRIEDASILNFEIGVTAKFTGTTCRNICFFKLSGVITTHSAWW